MNASTKFYDFWHIYTTYAENETMLSLCHYINSFSPEGATYMSTFYLRYSSFTFS